MLEVLDPDVVLRVDGGALSGGGMRVVRGAVAVATNARAFRRPDALPEAWPVLVNGAAGYISVVAGQPESVVSFAVVDGRIAAITILTDPERLARLDLDEIIG